MFKGREDKEMTNQSYLPIVSAILGACLVFVISTILLNEQANYYRQQMYKECLKAEHFQMVSLRLLHELNKKEGE